MPRKHSTTPKTSRYCYPTPTPESQAAFDAWVQAALTEPAANVSRQERELRTARALVAYLESLR